MCLIFSDSFCFTNYLLRNYNSYACLFLSFISLEYPFISFYIKLESTDDDVYFLEATKRWILLQIQFVSLCLFIRYLIVLISKAVTKHCVLIHIILLFCCIFLDLFWLFVLEFFIPCAFWIGLIFYLDLSISSSIFYKSSLVTINSSKLILSWDVFLFPLITTGIFAGYSSLDWDMWSFVTCRTLEEALQFSNFSWKISCYFDDALICDLDQVEEIEILKRR